MADQRSPRAPGVAETRSGSLEHPECRTCGGSGGGEPPNDCKDCRGTGAHWPPGVTLSACGGRLTAHDTELLRGRAWLLYDDVQSDTAGHAARGERQQQAIERIRERAALRKRAR